MRDEKTGALFGARRRDFLRWMTTVGALLALDRSKVLDVIADSGGSALANAACSGSNRSLHIVAGQGGLAWFQLLWPHVDIAKAADPNLAFHAPGEAALAEGTDTEFYNAPEAPWRSPGSKRDVSAFMAGRSGAHTTAPVGPTLDGGVSMIAAATVLQRANPSLVPVIGVADAALGTAPSGAPDLTSVESAEGIVGLFQSAAAQLFLANEGDADLFEAYYKGLLGLYRAAGGSTWARPLRTGKAAASLLGAHLANELDVTSEDLTRYGFPPQGQGAFQELEKLGRVLITTAKAFKRGLTQCVVVPALRDDPHGAFGDLPRTRAIVAGLGAMLDAFMKDLSETSDPQCAGKTLADTTILTVHGDTPKSPLGRGDWADATPQQSNWVYVLGNGYLKTGWFGGVYRDGSVVGFDPATGGALPWAPDAAASPAAAAALYAIARGDMRRVNDFYSGTSIDGIVRASPS